MNSLNLLRENQMLTRLKDASSEQVKTAFFANYFAALVMLKLQDIDGLHMINDPNSADLTKFKDKMSDVNFWARVLFKSDSPDVKNRMMFGHADALYKAAGRVSDSRLKAITKIPLTNPDQVNWNEVVGMLVLLKHRFGVTSSYVQNLTRYIFTWEKLSSSSRRKAVNDAFMFLMQADPKSALIPRLRALSNSVMINAIDGVFKKMIGFKRINEDGDAGTSVGNIASGTGDGGSGGNMIVTPPCSQEALGGNYSMDKKAGKQVSKKSKIVIKDGKIIKKKKKGFHPRKYKAPDFIKPESKASDQKVKFKDNE